MKIVIAGAFLLASVGITSASERVSSQDQAPFDWAGSYVGIQLGYGWGDSNFFDNEYNGAPPFNTVEWGVDSDGLLAGIDAGHNWRRDNVVFGIEGEIGRLDLSGGRLPPGVDNINFDPYDAAGTVDQGWYGGLSARLGYALNRTLLYTKAGAVYSNAKLGFVDTCTTAPCGNSTTDASKKVGWGYQLGAGAEYAVTDNWMAKAEYAYLDFGNSTISGVGVGGGFAGVAYKVRSDLSVHTVRAGVNYKF